MSLRKFACLWLLVASACGGESSELGALSEYADAGRAADSSSPAVVRDAGVVNRVDGPSAATDARVASPGDAGAVPDSAAMPAADSGVAQRQDAAVAHVDAGPVKLSCGSVPVYYLDLDGDGFGDPASGACIRRLNDVTDSADCYDHNAKAHPGAPDFQFKDRGDGSFDYDCDGISTHKSDAIANCAFPSTPGWGNPAIPDCGVYASWSTTELNPYAGSRCSTSSVVAQECR